MHLKWQPEKSVRAWTLRVLIGPAMVIDGVVHFLTFGCGSLGLSLEVSRLLAKERFRHISKKT